MEQNNCYLEEEKLFRLMLKFSIPCVLSMLVGALYNIIDQIFIGNSSVGTIGITATSVVFPMITIAMAFGLMLGDGATAYLSLCMGKRESDKIGKAIGSAITIVSMNMLAKYGAQSKYGANDPQAIIGMVMPPESAVNSLGPRISDQTVIDAVRYQILSSHRRGISAGCQPIFGFNYGAGRYDRVRKLLAWSCGACCASASLQQFYSRRSQRRSSAFSGQIHRTRRSIWNLAQGRCASICC